MASLDRAGIAERLRSLLGSQEDGDVARIAERLGLDEVSLRMSIDEEFPHPTAEVLAAVIKQYGIDPSWLLTGQYNAATHRSAMEGEGATKSALEPLMNDRKGPISEPTSERVHPPQHK